MKKIIILVGILTFLCSCGTKIQEYQKISVNEAIDIMNKNDYQIIDVRTKEEYDTYHIKSAINIPHTEIDNINISKDTIIFVYCKSGARSKQAALALIKKGYLVYDLGSIDTIGDNLE